MMEAVKKGAGRELAHEAIKEHAVQTVKDLRTGVESGQPDKVLDGDLDSFLNAALAARVHGTSTQVEDIE